MLYSSYIHKREIQLLPELKILASFQIKQYIQYFYLELTIKKYFLNSDQTIFFFFSGSVLDSILKVDSEIDRISNIRLFFWNPAVKVKPFLFFLWFLFHFLSLIHKLKEIQKGYWKFKLRSKLNKYFNYIDTAQRKEYIFLKDIFTLQ